MARLVKLVDEPDSEKRFHLTFERLPSGIQPGDVVINDEVPNRGTLIRNCAPVPRVPVLPQRPASAGVMFASRTTVFKPFIFQTEFNAFGNTVRAGC